MGGLAWTTWLGLAIASLAGAGVGVAVVGRSGRALRRCENCGYDLRATPGMTCPECGTTARSERRLRRRVRRQGRLWACSMGVLLGLMGAAIEPVRRDGWAAVVPAAVAWPLTRLFERDMLALEASLAGPIPPPLTRWERLLLARRIDIKVKNVGEDLPQRRLRAPTEPPPGTFVDIDVALFSKDYIILSAGESSATAALFALTLRASGDEAVLATPSIGALLRDAALGGDADEYAWSLNLIGRIGDAEGSTIGVLEELVRDPNAAVRSGVYGTLGKIAARNRRATSMLVAGLDDGDATVRLRVVGLLGGLGRRAAPALEHLKIMGERDPDPGVRLAVYQARAAIETGP